MVAPIEERSATGSGERGPAPDMAAIEADLAWRITRLEQLVAALGLLLERFQGPSPVFAATVFDNLDDPAASNAVLAILVESTADARRDLNAVRRGVRTLTGPDDATFDHPVAVRLRTLARSGHDLTVRFEAYRSTIGSGAPPGAPSTVARRHQVVALSLRSLLDIREVVDGLHDEERRLVPAAAAAEARPAIARAPERRRTPLAAFGLPLAGALLRGVGKRRTRLMVEFAGVLTVGFVVLVSALSRGGLPADSIPGDGLSGAGPGQTPGAVALASGAPGASVAPSLGPGATGTPPPPAESSAPPPPPHAPPGPTPAPAPTPNAVAAAVTKFAGRISAAAESIDGLVGVIATDVQDADFAGARAAADGIAARALTERAWLQSHPAKACYQSYHEAAMTTYGELIDTATSIAIHAEADDANAIHNDVAHSHLEVSTLRQAGTKAVAACA